MVLLFCRRGFAGEYGPAGFAESLSVGFVVIIDVPVVIVSRARDGIGPGG